MSLREFLMVLSKSEAEGEIVKTVFVSLLTSFLTLLILYFLKLRYVENFIPKYGFYLFFIVLSYAAIMPSVRYIRNYKEFPCMSGMMIGMTIGMIAGFLPGFYIAATNGMFVGSVFGMVVGITFGIINGKCCGIMGIMEGIMAGFMGGLMGAMTSFMLINDHLREMSIIVFIIGAIIITCLHYMMYKETKMLEMKSKESLFMTLVSSFILTIITISIMIFGWKNGIIQ